MSACARPAVALVAAYGEPGDERLGGRSVVLGGVDRDRGDADDLARGVGDDPQHPGLEAGSAHDHGAEVLVGLPLADRPLEEGVLERRRARPGTPTGRPRARRTPRAAGGRRSPRPRAAGAPSCASGPRTRGTRAAGHPRSPTGTGIPTTVAPRDRARSCIQWARAVPMPRPRYVGMDGRVAAVGLGELGVPDQPVAVEDADALGRHVEAGARPVADDVGLLDLDRAEVGELLGRHHVVDRAGVAHDERPGGQPVR